MIPLTVKPKANIKPHWPMPEAKHTLLNECETPEDVLEKMMKDAAKVRKAFKGGMTGNTSNNRNTSNAAHKKQLNAELRRNFIIEVMTGIEVYKARFEICKDMAVAGWEINPDTLTNDLGVLFRAGRIERQGAGNRVKYRAVQS